MGLQPKALFEALLYADTEAEVVRILTEAGYWNDPSVWRFYGDEPENWPTVGNQQSRPDHALVEKLTNAIDTKLIAAALIAGIPIEGDDAPETMTKARDLLFGEQMKKRKSKSNKGKIPFVQGKFNMGGSGVLEFCGVDHNVQLVLSRRNPKLLGPDPTEEEKRWSFTIIRRQDPDPDSPKSSRFVYLAPGEPDADGRRGLLTFDAPAMPIFPERNVAYAREAEWGTLFKLYEYGTRAVTGMMLKADS
jgi:hypothetical protein